MFRAFLLAALLGSAAVGAHASGIVNVSGLVTKAFAGLPTPKTETVIPAVPPTELESDKLEKLKTELAATDRALFGHLMSAEQLTALKIQQQLDADKYAANI